MRSRPFLTILGLLAALGASAPAARAQSVGIGPRFAFVRADTATTGGSDRFIGGALRMGSGKTVLELAIDYRSALSDNLLENVKDTPIQASFLLYPIKSAIAPYLIAGIGWYSQRIERFETANAPAPIDVETTRRFGYHAGLGGDIRLTRRIGLYGDYRYTFLHFGEDDDTGQTPGLIPFAERLKLSHEGSMFTWGAVLYF